MVYIYFLILFTHAESKSRLVFDNRLLLKYIAPPNSLNSYQKFFVSAFLFFVFGVLFEKCYLCRSKNTIRQPKKRRKKSRQKKDDFLDCSYCKIHIKAFLLILGYMKSGQFH